MNPADLDRLDLRRDLYEIRRALVEDVAAGQDPQPLLEALAARDPVALAELLVGPQAAKGAGPVRAALGVIGALEAKMAVNGLYRRLIDLAPEAGADVLSVAAARHPTAGWLGALSGRVEGALAGETHLRAAAAHPAFAALCWAYASGGHQRGLVAAATATGRPSPPPPCWPRAPSTPPPRPRCARWRPAPTARSCPGSPPCGGRSSTRCCAACCRTCAPPPSPSSCGRFRRPTRPFARASPSSDGRCRGAERTHTTPHSGSNTPTGPVTLGTRLGLKGLRSFVAQGAARASRSEGPARLALTTCTDRDPVVPYGHE